jgi:hypothetical protein
MSQQVLPVATARRTVTVRVRTLLITAGILAAAGLPTIPLDDEAAFYLTRHC